MFDGDYNILYWFTILGFTVNRAGIFWFIGRIAPGRQRITFALGTLTLGTLTLGTLTLGTLALGTLALGTLSLGTLSLGTLTLGTLALGTLTAAITF